MDAAFIDLSVYTVAEVSVSGRPGGMFVVPAGTGPPPAVPLRRRHRPRSRERVTWQRGRPGSALRNNRSIWGGPGDLSYSVARGEEAVDLEFIRGLPADSVSGLLLLTDAPRAARTDDTGDLVLLEEQDRTRWDQAMIADGEGLLVEALRMGQPDPYQLWAAIARLTRPRPARDVAPDPRRPRRPAGPDGP